MLSPNEQIPCPRFIGVIGFDGRTVWEFAQAPEDFPFFSKITAGSAGIFMLGPGNSIYVWTGNWWRNLVQFVPPQYNVAISAGPSGGVYAAGNVLSYSFVAFYDSNGNKVWFGVFQTPLCEEPKAISVTSNGIFVMGSSSIEKISAPQTLT